jgi:DNA modification methylase
VRNEVFCDIRQGDVLAKLAELPEESVHCVVTSPPYYGLRDYGVEGQIGLERDPQQYVSTLVNVFREVRRVLRKDGTLWVNIGDTYAANRSYQVPSTKGGPKHAPAQGFKDSGMRVPEGLKPKDLIGIPWRLAFALQADGWYLRSDIIWHKPNAMPTSAKDRPTTAHEYVFLLTKNEHYYYNAAAISEPATHAGKVVTLGEKSFSKRQALGMGVAPSGNALKDTYTVPETRNKRSVWSINTQPYKGAHAAVFPEALVEPCVLAGSPESGTVLDPFMGSGTTGVVALRHTRNFIGVELNPESISLARQRLDILTNLW